MLLAFYFDLSAQSTDNSSRESSLEDAFHASRKITPDTRYNHVGLMIFGVNSTIRHLADRSRVPPTRIESSLKRTA